MANKEIKVPDNGINNRIVNIFFNGWTCERAQYFKERCEQLFFDCIEGNRLGIGKFSKEGLEEAYLIEKSEDVNKAQTLVHTVTQEGTKTDFFVQNTTKDSKFFIANKDEYEAVIKAMKEKKKLPMYDFYYDFIRIA